MTQAANRPRPPIRLHRLAAGGRLMACILATAATMSGSLARGEKAEPLRRARLLMGTICSVTAYPRDSRTASAVEAALETIDGLEATLSTYREDSALSRLNRDAHRLPVPVSADLADFVRAALRISEATGGAFDPTVGSLVQAWDLRGEGRIPTADELDRARGAVGYRKVRLDPRDGTVSYSHPGLWIDPGGIGKGYALDHAAQVLRSRGVESALLDFGGQLLAVGAPPGEEAWLVAVADPGDRRRPALLLALRDLSASTSGQSERGRSAGGRWVGHILDPRSGAPVERRGSVTVIAPTGTEADGLATALFVMGADRGLEWAARQGRLAVGYLEPSRTGETGLMVRSNPAFDSLITARRRGVRSAGGAG